jgi:drug/metabolite transporter (DMT)-like permease
VRASVAIALAGGMVLFGTATPLARLVTTELPPLVGSALRVLSAAALLIPVAHAHGFRWSRMDRLDWQRALLIALVGMFGFTITLAYGMQRVSGATGAVIMGTTPAVTAVAAVVFLGEHATWRRWVAVVLSALGVVLMRLAGGGAGFELAGAALVFGAVLAEATYTLAGKRFMERHDAIAATMVATVISLPLFLVAALPQAGTVAWSEVSPDVWAAVLAWGLGTLAAGSMVWYWGVRRTEGHQAAPFMGLMPLSALVLSYVLLGEDPEWWHGAGLALVLGGIALVVLDRRAEA